MHEMNFRVKLPNWQEELREHVSNLFTKIYAPLLGFRLSVISSNVNAIPSTLGHLQEKRKANESNNLDKSFKKTIKIMQIPIALLIIPPQFPILRGYSNQNNPTNTSEQSDRG
jgi:hypothetical protein